MNYHKIEKTSVVNGTGIRTVLWVSGCSLHCKMCQNPQTWDFNSGKLFDEGAKEELLEALNNSYIQGITFSGGHPLEIENCPDVLSLILEIKTKFPHKDIWLYTGYELKIEDFLNNTSFKTFIINLCDVVVDGKYVDELKDITLKWRGSSNQRVIDVKETIKQKKIILYKDD